MPRTQAVSKEFALLLTRPDGSLTGYQYDVLDRLTQMATTVSGVTVNQYGYTYNQQDLRDSETTLDPTSAYADYLANYTYNNVNELTQVADPGSKNLTYDASGNLTGGYTPAGYAFTATYDGSNRLTTLSYTDGGGVVNRTEYYYLGHLLIWKKNFRNGVLTQQRQYTYDNDLLVQERDGANPNHVVNEYIYGLGLPGGIGGLLRLNQGGAAYSYLFDGKGNVTALLDGSTGQVAQTYQYDPFGVPLGGSGSINQPMRFSTKSYDDQTGLSYYGYRFYAPTLGRWLTRDPLGEMGGINLYGFVDSVGKPSSGTNLYAFCDNNPVNYIDPFGLQIYPPIPIVPSPPSIPPYPRLPQCPPSKENCSIYPPGSLLYWVCMNGGDNPWSNCVRQCLHEAYVKCSSFGCIIEDHIRCWMICPGGGGGAPNII